MSTNTIPESRKPDYVTGQHGQNASPIVFDVSTENLVDFVLGKGDTINPNQKIYVNAEDPEDFVTYEEVGPAIEAVAKVLRKRGIKKGDCVCIHSYNNITYPLLWLGIIAAGGIVTGSNPANTPQELVHHFSITNTVFVIVQATRVETISKAAEECSIPSERVIVFGHTHLPLTPYPSNRHFMFDFQSEGNETFVEPHDLIVRDDDTAAYATTSGTTGLPKAAELTHRYFIAQLMAIEELYTNRTEQTLRQLHCLPVFHAFAAPVAILLPLRLGITTYYLPRFHLTSYVNAVSQFQITDTAVVPPIIAQLTKLPRDQNLQLQSLRFMICAGAPLSTTLQTVLSEELHPDLRITQCWGCTETGWISAFKKHEVTPEALGSVGYPLSNTILKIVDSEGKDITEDGQVGEACIKSQSMLKGYRTAQGVIDKSEILDKDGFYATGDLARLEQGKIFIVGRVKDIMKVNGWQVSPDELQSVIMQLASQGVQDCAVMGCTYIDKDGLEVTKPRAYVVKHPESGITADGIRAYVKRQLVSYKQITRGVFFVDQIPRNATGKILRRLLQTENVVQQRDGETQAFRIATIFGQCRRAMYELYRRMILVLYWIPHPIPPITATEIILLAIVVGMMVAVILLVKAWLW